MLGWIIQIAIISFIFIYLVHHLLNFFKNMLTVPKVKDLVDSPNKKYEDIFATLNNTNKSFSNNNSNNSNNSFTEIDLLPSSSSNKDSSNTDMKDELKNFLKKQLNSNDNSNNGVEFFQPSGSANMFSDF
jgi:hypothetical protein